MKKVTLLCIVVMFAAVPAFSQVGIGIKGGVNFANLKIEDASSRTGFHFGGLLRVPLGENISLQPEVLFSTQGAELDDTDIDMTYVNVPILLRIKLASIANIHFGPQFGFVTKAESGDTDIKDNVKNSDIGGAVGAGIQLPLGLEAGARYNFGFTKVNDSDNSPIVIEDAKNRVLQLYVAWTFGG